MAYGRGMSLSEGRVWLGILGALLSTAVVGADWPCFRGPNHDGISRETAWRKNWTEAAPVAMWRAEVGIGFSAVSVAGDRVITTGHQDGEEVVWCLASDTGKVIWTHRHKSELGAKFYIGGPGATPSIDPVSGDVYVLGKWGQFFCLRLKDGTPRWQRNLVRDHNLLLPDWGFNGSALVVGDLVIVNMGTNGIALERGSGRTKWASEGSESGYSTPLPYEVDGHQRVVVSSGEGYSGVEPTTGELIWTVPWFTRYGVNAADPIVWQGRLFISSGYSKGAGQFTLSPSTKGDELQMVWKQRRFRAQQNAPVRLGEYLYGFDGDSSSRAKLKCVEWNTGEVVWEDETLGYGALSAAGEHLILIGADGQLGLAVASPKAFEPVLGGKVLAADCWTVPVLAGGKILCRNSHGSLVCLDVSL